MKNKIKEITAVGAFTSLAMIFSYIEALIPFNFGIPGIKLGLANIVILVGLYIFSFGEVLLISFIRVFLSSLLFSNGMSFIYSISGAALSLIFMFTTKKTGLFSPAGVSMIGGVFHNIGQILAAYFIMRTFTLEFYLPVLMISGIITGFALGVISFKIIPILKKNYGILRKVN